MVICGATGDLTRRKLAPAIYNLVPEANGVVRIDRKLLGDRQEIFIYAEDLHSAVFRNVSLPELPTSATVSPGCTVSDTSFSASRSAPA